MANLVGQFLWYEVMTKEIPKTIEFYTNVIGWGTQASRSEMVNGNNKPYTMFTCADGPIGGIVELPQRVKQDDTSAQWIAYVGVANVNESIQMAIELGAEIIAPVKSIEKLGTFCTIRDPQGGEIALYTPVYEPHTRRKPPKSGEIAWHELMTSDPDSAWNFYKSLFSWEVTDTMDMGDMGSYLMYGLNGETFGGIFRSPPEHQGSSSWLYYTTVYDLEVAVDLVNKNGGKVLNGPMDVPGGDRIAQCMDSQGGAFALHVPALRS